MRIRVWQLLMMAVIAVWATLVGVWLVNRPPGMAKACVSNVYGLSWAFAMYAGDHDGLYPPAEAWVDCLSPYVNSPASCLKCPQDRSSARCSYGMNERLGGMPLVETESVLIYGTVHPGDNPHGGPEDVADPPRHAAGNVYARCYVPSAGHWLPEEGGPRTPSFTVEGK